MTLPAEDDHGLDPMETVLLPGKQARAPACSRPAERKLAGTASASRWIGSPDNRNDLNDVSEDRRSSGTTYPAPVGDAKWKHSRVLANRGHGLTCRNCIEAQSVGLRCSIGVRCCIVVTLGGSLVLRRQKVYCSNSFW